MLLFLQNMVNKLPSKQEPGNYQDLKGQIIFLQKKEEISYKCINIISSIKGPHKEMWGGGTKPVPPKKITFER